MINNPTIGSDVEFFLHDGTEFVSAEGYIPGSKRDPHRFDPEEPFYATQLDNVLAEGNIPPSPLFGTPTAFISSLDRLRNHIDSLVLEHGLMTVATAAARLDDRFLQTENAKMMGCDASKDCWTLRTVKPKLRKGETLRTAGFHIHVGYGDPDDRTNILLGRLMDLYLGIPTMLAEPESERTKLGYGTAGNYRDQPHGFEYRVLSSFWAGTAHRMRFVFNRTAQAVHNLERIEVPIDVQRIINERDMEAGRALVAAFDLVLP